MTMGEHQRALAEIDVLRHALAAERRSSQLVRLPLHAHLYCVMIAIHGYTSLNVFRLIITFVFIDGPLPFRSFAFVSRALFFQVHEAAAKSATHLNRLQVECNALTRECAQLQDDNRTLALVRTAIERM